MTTKRDSQTDPPRAEASDDDAVERALAPPPPGAAARIAELEAVLAGQQRRLAGMLTIASNLARSREPRRAMKAIVAEISALLEADRTTIYEYDPEQNMLRGLAVQGETDVMVGVPVGHGIAGLVAARGRAINLKDAYLHPAFDAKFDRLTGYRTRSMLCVPMRTPNREIVGVVQVLNKRSGYFSVDDQHLLEALAAQAAITLEALHLQVRLDTSNAELHSLTEELRQRVSELELLNAIEQATVDAADVPELLAPVLRHAAEVARVEAAALFLPGESGVGPVYVRGPGEAGQMDILPRVEVGEGILGQTAADGEPHVLLAGHEKDDAIERTLGGGSTLTVVDAVTTPLVDGERTIGALALVNRRGRDRRDPAEDERLAYLMAGQLARAVGRITERQSAQMRDRLMAIGQMLGGVLHDLRGPMAIISGYSQLMADQDDAVERGEMSAAIRRQVALFNDMTRELLSFVRGERTVFARRVYLHKFVQQARELLEPEFKERGIEFVVEDHTDGTAFFDEPKMLRVVANIARNARQAMGDHGRFTWVLRTAEDGHTEFEMTDDGPGVPEAIRDKLFEAFTTAGKDDGTGLGLAIVRRIVEDHGGTVSFSTETGKGTTFTLRLPPVAGRTPA